jgi:hypothetical protein
VASAWERFSAADTLIYVDLPLLTHYRWVTFIKGLFASPKGWPENSPLWSSTLSTGVLDWPPSIISGSAEIAAIPALSAIDQHSRKHPC